MPRTPSPTPNNWPIDLPFSKVACPFVYRKSPGHPPTNLVAPERSSIQSIVSERNRRWSPGKQILFNRTLKLKTFNFTFSLVGVFTCCSLETNYRLRQSLSCCLFVDASRNETSTCCHLDDHQRFARET